jgi:hypothetical protein
MKEVGLVALALLFWIVFFLALTSPPAGLELGGGSLLQN